ncbi:hypothetical protein HDU97_002137 [Phlyctochytrium planicorne]|nr:hypothetical protein HDU97_002137 [Phlyctochytrium planicorne]
MEIVGSLLYPERVEQNILTTIFQEQDLGEDFYEPLAYLIGITMASFVVAAKELKISSWLDIERFAIGSCTASDEDYGIFDILERLLHWAHLHLASGAVQIKRYPVKHVNVDYSCDDWEDDTVGLEE